MNAVNPSALGASLALDAFAVLVLAYLVYYRRHRRRDLLMAFVTFNAGLFAVVTVLALGEAAAGLALGLGLFGALSVIRLRSEELTFVEIAYFFSALALAIVNGIGVGNFVASAALSALVVVAPWALDRLGPEGRTRRVVLVLDEALADPDAARMHLERRLETEVRSVAIREVDFVRETTRLEADYAAAAEPVPAADEPARSQA